MSKRHRLTRYVVGIALITVLAVLVWGLPGLAGRPVRAAVLTHRHSIAPRSRTTASPPASTTQVDLNYSGGQPDGNSSYVSMSADGRYIVYSSYATNLVSIDTNGFQDVFLYDTLLHVNSLVSMSATGVQGNGASWQPVISGNGQFVAFESAATNLTGSPDTNNVDDILLKNLATGAVSRVSVDSSGNQATGSSQTPSISYTGGYVAFLSYATNLVSGDNNGTYDVFFRDTSTSSTTRVSLAYNGTEANGGSYVSPASAISDDGRYVTFVSQATNLTQATDNNGFTDVFVRDRDPLDPTHATTMLVSQTTAGVLSNGASSQPTISRDGRYVYFQSSGSNLPGAVYCNPGYCDSVFQRDLQAQPPSTTIASVNSNGDSANRGAGFAHLSANGRYLGFSSTSSNLGPTGNNCGTFGCDSEAFIRDLATNQIAMPSVDGTGNPMVADIGSVSQDAEYVPFTSGNHIYLRFNPTPFVPAWQLLGSGNGIDALTGCFCDASGQPLGFVGDPVNLATGSFYNAVTDATMPNIGVPFAFARTYNSADNTPAQSPAPSSPYTPIDQPIPMSQGWTSAYNIYLRQFDWAGDLVLHAGDGQQVVFVKQANGTFLGGPGVRDSLTKNGDNTFTVLRHDQVKYQLDTSGNITSFKDRNNEGLTFSYTSGHVTSISGNGAWTVTLGYTGGRVTSMSLPLSRSVAYHYNAANLLDQVTDIRSNQIRYTYTTAADTGQPLNLLKTIRDQNGNTVTQNTYGADGRVVSQLDARNHSLLYGWNPQTQIATYTDARGKVWSYTYSNGTLIQVKDPLGNLTKYGFDGDLNGSALTDARNNTTSYVYDNSGNLTQENDPAPLSYQENWTYDSANNMLSFANGRTPRRTTMYGYDATGNLTCVSAPMVSPPTTCSAASSDSKSTYGRDPSGTGLLWSITDRNGNTTNFRYNAMGEPTNATTPLGFITQMCYDAGGRMTNKVDPRGAEACGSGGPFTWSYSYNNANQMRTMTDPLASVTTLTYDADGNLTSKTDGNNHVTRYEYDASNNLTCVLAPTTSATTCATAPSTSKTTYLYDNNGDVTSRTDSNSHSWSWDYDDASRPLHTTSPRGKVWAYDYWPNNLLKTKTLPSNGTISYDYDAMSRLKSLTYSNAPTTPNVTFTYDANGNRTQMTDGSGTVNYVWDDSNRMSTATRGTDQFAYTYYPAGQVKQSTYPDSTWIGYQYDADERMCSATTGGITTSCTSPLSTTTTYGYDQANDVTTKTFPNGYVSTMTYDNADRLMSVGNVKSGSTLSSFTFGSRDSAGNPQSLTTFQNATTTSTYYTYDAMDRLTGACSLQNCTGTGLTGLGYTYDTVGNRLTQVRYGTPNVTTTYAYNADDQLCWSYVGTSSNPCGTAPTGATSYTFSQNGNETAAGSTTYAYDQENRMTLATIGGTSTSYSYDGDGNRLSATTGSSTTNSLWDINAPLPQLAVERDGSGSVLRDYVYGMGPVSLNSGGTSYTYLTDAYGSVANLTSSVGAAEWTYAYDPFGGDAGTTKNDPNAPANQLRFDSQTLDGPSGFYNLRARGYDPASGRTLQPDPVPPTATEAFSASYVYSLDQPTVLSDPSGMCSGWGLFLDAFNPFRFAGEMFGDWKAGFSELFQDWKAGVPAADNMMCGNGAPAQYIKAFSAIDTKTLVLKIPVTSFALGKFWLTQLARVTGAARLAAPIWKASSFISVAATTASAECKIFHLLSRI